MLVFFINPRGASEVDHPNLTSYDYDIPGPRRKGGGERGLRGTCRGREEEEGIVRMRGRRIAEAPDGVGRHMFF